MHGACFEGMQRPAQSNSDATLRPISHESALKRFSIKVTSQALA
ncbi:hypothetical protein SynPROS71_02039 [Synechococcus sp. PROS-7-1]|nr:hypothetical protein SynPROS71_02039 [Synechococcus sp. PROS-7-1]